MRKFRATDMAKSAKKSSSTTGREANAFPFLGTPMSERLKLSHNIDLINNHTTIDLGNGYCEIRPIDDTRLSSK